MIAEKQRRHAKGEVQYLTDAQLDCIVEQNPESDIRDYEDLQTGNVTFNTRCMKPRRLCSAAQKQKSAFSPSDF